MTIKKKIDQQQIIAPKDLDDTHTFAFFIGSSRIFDGKVPRHLKFILYGSIRRLDCNCNLNFCPV